MNWIKASVAAVVIVSSTSPIRSVAAQGAGLVAAYSFNEPTGTTVADVSGAGNSGIVGAGVSRTSNGRFGAALAFASGRVTIPNSASLTLTSAVTLEAWVNPSLVNSLWRDVVYKADDNYFLMGTTETGGRPAGGGLFGAASNTTQAYAPTSLPLNTWTHLAMTYDGAAVRLYVNGIQVSTVARSGAIRSSTNPLTIGGDPIYGQYFQGLIDEVRVYNRALAAAEIQQDMNTPVGAPSGPDGVAPSILVTTPTSTGSFLTNSNSLALGGSASDNVGVMQVSWVNSAGGSGTATGTVNWTASVPLQAGSNLVTVTARDAATNQSSASINVTVDQTMPAVAITSPTAGATLGGPVAVTAQASDDLSLTGVQFFVDGIPLGAEVTGSGPTFAALWVTGGATNGGHVLTARARDAAGNSTLSAPVSVSVSNTAPASLVAAYSFDESSGSSVLDLSGNNNAGTFGSGVTRTAAGRFGGALVFTGGRVTVPNASALLLTAGMTLEAWVNPTVVSSAWRDVVYKGDDNYFIMGTTENGGRPSGGGIFGTSTNTTQAYASATLPLNTWTHLATSYDGSVLRFYINGTLISTTPRSGAIKTSANPLTIGGDAIYGQFFRGMIDEVRLHNRALTPGEIQSDMTTPLGATPVADVSPPTITVQRAPTFTNASSVTLTGNSADNVGVTQVNWSSDRGGTGTASGTSNWTAAVGLQAGSNVITLSARDAASNVGTTSVTVILDQIAPVVAITTPASSGTFTTTTSPVSIGGSASDASGVAQITWTNNRGGSGSAIGTNVWNVSTVALQAGANVITATARDNAGNIATASIVITLDVPDTTNPTITVSSPTSGTPFVTSNASLSVSGTAADNVSVVRVSWSNSAGGSGVATGTASWSVSGVNLQPGLNLITVTAVDAANNSGSAQLNVTLDQVPPSVAVTAPLAGATLSGASVQLAATASDNNALVAVQFLLDGSSLGPEVSGIGPDYVLTWNSTVALNGPHVLSARVRDAAGTTALAPDVAVNLSNSRSVGLVASYGFEENGSTVSDASGNGNNGSFGTGVVRSTAGRIGAALQFLGTGMVTIPHSASLNLSDAMTLEAWVKPSAISNAWRDLVYKGDDRYFLMATSMNTSAPAGGGTFGGASNTTEAVGPTVLPTNVWTHLSTTYDGASVRLFVNGTLVSSVSRTGPIASSTNPLTIGGDAIYGQFFQGLIDEVRVYSRALQVAEIQADMAQAISDPTPPANPAVVGQWSAPFSWPLISIHTALLKTGEVMGWEFSGAGGPYLWNPTTSQFARVANAVNLFCAGQTVLPDGRILIAGGHVDAHVGLSQVTIFDPATRVWSTAPSMYVGRWYPTVTTLADGRALITAGETHCDGCNALIPELYDPASNQITQLTTASANFPYYPHVYQLPDSRVFVAGTSEAPIASQVLDLTTGTWTTVDPHVVDGGSSVMYLPGKVMKSGTSHDPDKPVDPSSAKTYVIDMTSGSPAWVETAPMAFARTYHNLTILPDGNVLVTGGGSTSDAIGSTGAVLAAELWSPASRTYTTLASGEVPRLYHSVGLLLPDGRVLVSGGGRFNGFPSNDPSDRLDAEIYSPPYLFKGARPTITSAPESGTYGETITLQSPDVSSIASISLIRLGAVTHSINMDQRFVPLQFIASSGQLNVSLPSDANLAPPGYYMLFLVNSNGVPSKAAIIQVR